MTSYAKVSFRGNDELCKGLRKRVSGGGAADRAPLS